MIRLRARRWFAAFVGASVLLILLQPLYIEHLLGRVAAATVSLVFAGRHLETWIDGARLVWRVGEDAGAIGLRLVSYHVALYLTAILAIEQVEGRVRVQWAATGLPLLLLWQLGDVLLGVESQWLTLTRPAAYDVEAGIDPWFLLVKFASNLNVLALRQLVPFAIIGVQWWHWNARCRDAEGEGN